MNEPLDETFQDGMSIREREREDRSSDHRLCKIIIGSSDGVIGCDFFIFFEDSELPIFVTDLLSESETWKLSVWLQIVRILLTCYLTEEYPRF